MDNQSRLRIRGRPSYRESPNYTVKPSPCEETYNSSSSESYSEESPIAENKMSKRQGYQATKLTGITLESKVPKRQPTKLTKSAAGGDDHNENKSGKMVVIFLSLLTAVAVIYWIGNKDTKNGERCHFTDLPVKHHLAAETTKYLNMLSANVYEAFTMRSPSLDVVLFVHNGSAEMHKAIQGITERVSKCYGAKTTLIPAETFTAEQAISDYGYVIERFTHLLNSGARVFQIPSLNEIPAESAKALHFICDTYSPPTAATTNVIVLLSLVVSPVGSGPTKGGREKLEELWQHTLSKDELNPLINRLTNLVIPLIQKPKHQQ